MPGTDFGDDVKAGISGAATGAAIAGAGAAIGAAAGASLGPFAVIAAPIGAAIGALIGFFVSLGKSDPPPTPEQLAAAAKAKEKLLEDYATSNGKFVWQGAEMMATVLGLIVVQDLPVAEIQKQVNKALARKDDAYLNNIVLAAKRDPQYQPILDGLRNAAHAVAAMPTQKERAVAWSGVNKLKAMFHAIAQISDGPFHDDPFEFFRPPMSAVLAPLLKAAGIDIGDPSLLASIRGKYDLGVAKAAIPRVKVGTLPIARRSLGLTSGGKIAVDQRAFSPTLCPFGVVSYAIAPSTASQPWYTQEPYASSHGVPLKAPWPYGLDADRFALPPRPVLGVIAGLPTVIKVGVPAAAVVAALLFL